MRLTSGAHSKGLALVCLFTADGAFVALSLPRALACPPHTVGSKSFSCLSSTSSPAGCAALQQPVRIAPGLVRVETGLASSPMQTNRLLRHRR